MTPDSSTTRDPSHPEGSRASAATGSTASSDGRPVDHAGDQDDGVGPSRRGRRQGMPLWQESIILLLLALGLAILLKTLFVQAFYIPSDSMNDTLIRHDRILVEKPSYWFGGSPQRGDIVVFRDPGGWLGDDTVADPSPVTRTLEFFGLYPTGDHLVKRVIGVGGDTVKCCDRAGRLIVNGTPLNESSYLRADTEPGDGPGGRFEVNVPDGMLWVMGDNRGHSADSRAHMGSPGGGFIPVDDVVGKVWVTIWPLDRISLTDRPATFERLDGAGG